MKYLYLKNKSWKEISVIAFFSIGIIGFSNVQAQTQITAQQFQWMAQSSAPIMDTVQHYNRQLDQLAPYVFIDHDAMLTPGYEYFVDTPAGNWRVGPIEGRIGLYAGSPKLGLLFVMNGINLLIHKDHRRGLYQDIQAWSLYHYVGAVRYAYSDNLQFIIGSQMKEYPVFIAQNDEIKFGAEYDTGGKLRTNDYDIEAFYLFRLWGFDLNGMYNFDNSSPNLFDMGTDLYKDPYWGRVYGRVRYTDFDQSWQVLAQWKKWMLTSFLLIDSSVVYNIYSKMDNRAGLQSTHILFTFVLWGRAGHLQSVNASNNVNKIDSQKDSLKESDIHSNKFVRKKIRERPLTWTVSAGASVTQDFFDKRLSGWRAQTALHNLQLFSTISQITLSYFRNDPEALARLPLPDQNMWQIHLELYY